MREPANESVRPRSSAAPAASGSDGDAHDLDALRPLEELEELAVATDDHLKRARLERAVLEGREARGGSSESGGAILSGEAATEPTGSRVDLAVWGMLNEGSTHGTGEKVATARLPRADRRSRSRPRLRRLVRRWLAPGVLAILSFVVGVAFGVAAMSRTLSG